MRLLEESLEIFKIQLDKAPRNHALALPLALLWRGWTGDFLWFSDGEAGVGHHIQPFAIKGFDSSVFQLEDPF